MPPVIKEPRKAFDHVIDAARFLDFCLETEELREDPLPQMTIQAVMEKMQHERVFGPLRSILAEAREMEEQNGVVW